MAAIDNKPDTTEPRKDVVTGKEPVVDNLGPVRDQLSKPDVAKSTDAAVAPADNAKQAKTPDQSYEDIFNKSLQNANNILDCAPGDEKTALAKAERFFQLALKQAQAIDQKAVDDQIKALTKQQKEDTSLTKDQRDVIDQKLQDLDALKNAEALIKGNWGLTLVRLGDETQANAGSAKLSEAVNLDPALKGDPNFLAHYQTAVEDHQAGTRGTGAMPVITAEQLAQARGDGAVQPQPKPGDQGPAVAPEQTRTTETPEQRGARIDAQRAAAVQREEERHNKVLHDIDDIYQAQKQATARPTPQGDAPVAPAKAGTDTVVSPDVTKTPDRGSAAPEAAPQPRSLASDATALSQFLNDQFNKLKDAVAVEQQKTTDDAAKVKIGQTAFASYVDLVKRADPKFKEMIKASDEKPSELLPEIVAREKVLADQLKPVLDPPTPEIKAKRDAINALVDKAVTDPNLAKVIKSVAENNGATTPEENEAIKKNLIDKVVPLQPPYAPTKEQSDLRTQLKTALDDYDTSIGKDVLAKRMELNGLVGQESIERQQSALTRFAYAQALISIGDKAGAKQQVLEAAARVQTPDVANAMTPSIEKLGITNEEIAAEVAKNKSQPTAAPDKTVTGPAIAPEQGKGPVVAPEQGNAPAVVAPEQGKGPAAAPDQTVKVEPAPAKGPVVAPEQGNAPAVVAPEQGKGPAAAPDQTVKVEPALAKGPVVAPEQGNAPVVVAPEQGKGPVVAPEQGKGPVVAPEQGQGPAVAPVVDAAPKAPAATDLGKPAAGEPLKKTETGDPVVAPKAAPGALDKTAATTDAAVVPGQVPTDQQAKALAKAHIDASTAVRTLQQGQIDKAPLSSEAKAEFLKTQDGQKAGLATMDGAFAPLALYEKKVLADRDAYLKGLSPADKAVVDRRGQLTSDLNKLVGSLAGPDQAMFDAISSGNAIAGVPNWAQASDNWIGSHKAVVDAFNARIEFGTKPENEAVLEPLQAMEGTLRDLGRIDQTQAMTHLTYAVNLSRYGTDKEAGKAAFEDSFKNLAPDLKAAILADPDVQQIQREIMSVAKDVLGGIYGDIKPSGKDDVDKLAKEGTVDSLFDGAKNKLREANGLLVGAKDALNNAMAKKNNDQVEAAKTMQTDANTKSRKLYEEADKMMQAAVIKADTVDMKKLSERVTQIQQSIESGKVKDDVTGKERAMTTDERRQAHSDVLSLLDISANSTRMRHEYEAFHLTAPTFLNGERHFDQMAKTANSFGPILDKYPVDLMNKEQALLLRDIADGKNKAIQSDLMNASTQFNLVPTEAQVKANPKLQVGARQLPVIVAKESTMFFVSGGNQLNGQKIGYPPGSGMDTKINDAERAWYFRDKWVELNAKINNRDERDLDIKDAATKPFDAKAQITARSSQELQEIETLVRNNSSESLLAQRDKAGRGPWLSLANAATVGTAMTVSAFTWWAMSKSGAGGAGEKAAVEIAATEAKGFGTGTKLAVTGLLGESSSVGASWATHQIAGQKDFDLTDAAYTGSALFAGTALTVLAAKSGMFLKRLTPEAMDSVGLGRIIARDNAMAPTVARDFSDLSVAERKAQGLIGATKDTVTPVQVFKRTGEPNAQFQADSANFAAKPKNANTPLHEIEEAAAPRAMSPDIRIARPAQRDLAVINEYKSQGISMGQTGSQAHATATAGSKMKPTEELTKLAQHPEWGNTPIATLRDMAKGDSELLKKVAPIEQITEASAQGETVGKVYQQYAEAQAASTTLKGTLTEESQVLRDGTKELETIAHDPAAPMTAEKASDVLAVLEAKAGGAAHPEIETLKRVLHGAPEDMNLEQAIARSKEVLAENATKLDEIAAQSAETESRIAALKLLSDDQRYVGLTLEEAKKAVAESAQGNPELQKLLDGMYGATPQARALWLNSLPTTDAATAVPRGGIPGFLLDKVPTGAVNFASSTRDFAKGINPFGIAPQSINNASLAGRRFIMQTPGYAAFTMGTNYADKNYQYRHEGMTATPWESMKADWGNQLTDMKNNPWSAIPSFAWSVGGSLAFSNMLASEMRYTVGSGFLFNARNALQPLGEAQTAGQLVRQLNFWGTGTTFASSILNPFDPGKGFIDSRVFGAGPQPTWNSAVTNRENTKKLFSGPGMFNETQFQPPSDQPGLTAKRSMDPPVIASKPAAEVVKPDIKVVSPPANLTDAAPKLVKQPDVQPAPDAQKAAPVTAADKAVPPAAKVPLAPPKQVKATDLVGPQPSPAPATADKGVPAGQPVDDLK